MCENLKKCRRLKVYLGIGDNMLEYKLGEIFYPFIPEDFKADKDADAIYVQWDWSSNEFTAHYENRDYINNVVKSTESIKCKITDETVFHNIYIMLRASAFEKAKKDFFNQMISAGAVTILDEVEKEGPEEDDITRID